MLSSPELKVREKPFFPLEEWTGGPVVMVYLEEKNKKLPTCAFKESPGTQAKAGETTCQILSVPKVVHVKKKAELFLPKT